MWQLALAGASAAAGLFSAYDGFNANRHILRDLNKIKQYLKEIKKATNELKVQNELILKKLDELPEKIRQIVSEVIDLALLREPYSDIADVYENFLILRPKPILGYGIHSEEWQRFSKSMSYLFDYEYRLSRVFDLINICELALVITKDRVKTKVAIKIEEKTKNIEILYTTFIESIEGKLKKLKIDLDNSTYILNHNLSETLANLDDLIINLQPDKIIAQNYTESVTECHYEGGGGVNGNGGGRVCTTRHIVKTREVPDAAFHKSRDEYHRKITDQLIIIRDELNQLNYVSAIVFVLKQYRKRISDKSIEILSLEEQPLYFSDSSTILDDVGLTAVAIDFEDMKDYRSGFALDDDENSIGQTDFFFNS